jgi:hypothetical protein
MRSLFFLALILLTATSVLWAKQGLVQLKDGSQFVADVTDGDAGTVVVDVKGVRQTYTRDQIASIDWLVNIDERFNSKLLKLSPRDVPGRLELADWARRIERFDLARKAVDQALKIDPDDVDAQTMSRLIQHETRNFTIVAEEKPTLPTIPPPLEKPYLRAEQINVIRQAELKAGEGFRVAFLNDVRARFLALHLIDASTFYSLTDDDQAERILNEGDPAMAKDVRIDTDPASLQEFRDHVEPFIFGGCAVSGCHNTTSAAGGFALFTGDESPEAWLTNFYILETWRGRHGPEAGRLMIDRTYPGKSLLAEFSLPPESADMPHPAVQNFRRIFASPSDPHYQAMIHWIGFSLRPEVGGYPSLDYQPPWTGATTQP